MATTKKVASRKATRKKTVSTKTKKSSAAPAAKKKVAAKKTLKKKFASKPTRTRAERTTFNKKLAAVEALHKKESTPEPKKSQVPSTFRLKKPTLRDSLALRVLSPYRFPMSIDTLAIQTARIGGVAFVLLGGFFALHFSQYLWSDGAILSQYSSSLTGQVCDASVMSPFEYQVCSAGESLQQATTDAGTSLEQSTADAGTTLNEEAGIEQTTLAGETDAAGTALNEEVVAAETGLAEEIIITDPNILSVDNTQPTVTFSFGQASPLRGVVNININVDGADLVELHLFRNSFLGGFQEKFTAVRAGGDNWEVDLDTTAFPDGDYLVRARAYNAYEPNGYNQEYPSVLEFANETIATTPDVAADTEPEASLRLLSPQPSHLSARIEVTVPGAEEVRFFATASDGSVSYLSGEASATTDANRWVYTWNTESYPSGKYTVTARIRNNTSGDRYNSPSLPVNILHPTVLDLGDDITDEEITTDSPAADTETSENVPEATLTIRDGKTLSGFTEMRVDTVGASRVTIHAIPEGSAVKKHLGTATRISPTIWIYRYNTIQMPNGTYTLYPEVTNAFGTYQGDGVEVDVKNALSFYSDPEETSDIITAVNEVVAIEEEVTNERLTETVTSTQQAEAAQSTSTESILQAQKEREVFDIVARFNERIDEELRRFASAYRSGDEEVIAAARVRIERMKDEIKASVAGRDDAADLVLRINTRVDTVVAEYTEAIYEVDALIAQRIEKDVFADSDSDGISDYDEVRIYKTDPLVADSDGDGFIDGAEVESGFDPTDSRREAAITYESPKEKGIVRSDVLKITALETAVVNERDDSVQAEAVITGIGLPNSFVTIYIFSTPIVVTVKTDEDGAWRYRFDKELEEGEHNVYVGVTDNAGKIVAKSEPFAFIKEAQAFTPIDAAVSGSAQIVDTGAGTTILSQYMIYLIISISVVSIGLVLILLGLHLDTRGRRYTEVVSKEE